MITKKEYFKPICEEQVLSVKTHLLGEMSSVNTEHTDPFSAPPRHSQPIE